MRRLFGSKNRNLGKAKFVHNRFYFEDELNPVEIHIPKDERLEFFVNDEPMTGEFELSPTDKVEIIYNNNVAEPAVVDYKVNVNYKKDTAKLKKTVTNGTYYELKPIKDYDSVLKLTFGKVTKPPEQTDNEYLVDFLRSKNLKGDYLHQNIAEISISEEDIAMEVVVGKSAVPGKPARFELIEGLADGLTVQAQEFFATFVDETPGENGYDVYGEETSVDDLSFFPDFGNNVLVEDRGLLSLKTGRVIFTPYNIDIVEQEQVNKTINWEDGLVVYEGDVVLDGDIKEGGQIKCTGNLIVNGGVFESYVFSDGDITINGNTDQSVIYSGFSKLAASNIEKFSLQYLMIIERVMFETSFTAEDGMNYEEKAKSLELAQSEFKAIEQSTAPFISIVQQFGSPEIVELFETFETVTKQAVEVTLDDQSNSEDIRSVMELFHNLIEESKTFLRDELGNLTIESANNTHMFSYKDTDVTGSGTFQSNIESSSSVRIAGKCLSTSVEAPGTIDINEFTPGNNGESYIYLTKRNGLIKVGKLSADSVVRYEDMKRYIDDDMENAVFDKDSFK